jgi:hypothetical protein
MSSVANFAYLYQWSVIGANSLRESDPRARL